MLKIKKRENSTIILKIYLGISAILYQWKYFWT